LAVQIVHDLPGHHANVPAELENVDVVFQKP
jgi:hypothetical protein